MDTLVLVCGGGLLGIVCTIKIYNAIDWLMDRVAVYWESRQ